MGNEIIKVLDALCDKFGIIIDWSSDNVFPYFKELCEKFIRWEIGTSITWIILAILAVVIVGIISKVGDSLFFIDELFYMVLTVAFIIIGFQIFDIVECCTFPEKAIFDYIMLQYN